MAAAIHDLDADVVELAPYVPSAASPACREVAFRANAWTPADIDTLRRLFAADAALDEIVAATGHKLHGVTTKLWELGLRRESRRPWSLLEDEVLVARYGEEPAARIAQDLGRSCSAVYVQASLLGLSQAGAPAWEPWEDAQLAAGYAAATPVAQIAALIGRPLSGTFSRAGFLKLRHPAHPPGWSDIELARALALAHEGRPYPEIMATLVAEGFPVRTKSGFGPRLRKLGYGRGWGRPWSPDEDRVLRGAYAVGDSLTLVAEKTGRDRWSVASRAHILKLQGSHPRPNGFRQGPDWSEADEAKLRAEYGSKPVKLLAAELGRPLRAVYCHANSLGLKHTWMRAFSAEEDLALAAAWLLQVAIADVAICLDRDLAVVSKRAIRIGVSFSDARRPSAPQRGVRRQPGRPATVQELLALAPPEEIATRLQQLGITLAGTKPRGRASPRWGQSKEQAFHG